MMNMLLTNSYLVLAQEPPTTGIPIWVWILLGIILLAVILGLVLGSRTTERDETNTRSSMTTDSPSAIPQTGTRVDETPVTVVEDTSVKVYESPLDSPAVASTEGVPTTEDLTVIEGIGPGIQQILQSAGIYTFDQLARARPEDLREIVRKSGLRISDPSSWPEQASLAASGKWDELKELQNKLQAGRRV